MKENDIGFQLRTVSNLIRRNLEKLSSFKTSQCLTGAHGWVIGYLYDNRHRDVYQRDFEAEFQIRRSTITSMLKLMEKNGLITAYSRRLRTWRDNCRLVGRRDLLV